MVTTIIWIILETYGQILKNYQGISCTLVGEINNLTWEDVNLHERYLVLYTRKKRGGHLTPRKISMSEKLYQIFHRRYQKRDKRKPWVFWHRYWSRKKGEFVECTLWLQKENNAIIVWKSRCQTFWFPCTQTFWSITSWSNERAHRNNPANPGAWKQNNNRNLFTFVRRILAQGNGDFWPCFWKKFHTSLKQEIRRT